VSCRPLGQQTTIASQQLYNASSCCSCAAWVIDAHCTQLFFVQPEVLYKHHLLESETYIGGKVEALESGVFRSDLPTRFKCKQTAYQGLIDCLDRDLTYAITHEAGWELSDVANYDEVKAEITQMLEALRDAPNR